MKLSQRKLFIARFEEFAEENRLGDFMICDLRGRMCGILFRGHPCRDSVPRCPSPKKFRVAAIHSVPAIMPLRAVTLCRPCVS